MSTDPDAVAASPVGASDVVGAREPPANVNDGRTGSANRRRRRAMKAEGREIRKNRIRGTRHDPPTNAWLPGQTGNTKGTPRKGMSTAETIRTLKALTPDELRRVLREAGGTGRSGLEQSLGAMPKGVPLGMLMHASAITTSVCDPQPGILSYLRDSDEGKPVERQEIAGAGGGAVKVEYNLKMTFPSRKEHAASEPKPGDAAKPAGG